MTLGKKILTGFITCAIVLASVAVFSYKNSSKFIASSALVNKTNQVLYGLEQIYASTTDGETAVRGFIITGEDTFLEPYVNSELKIADLLDNIKPRTAVSPSVVDA